ncbi:MAG: diguanylate cyclase, partial [Gammaproteobacteria bacterium]
MTTANQREQLKKHFARRVTNQARLLIDRWNRIQANPPAHHDWVDELYEEAEKLGRYAARFDMHEHIAAANQLLSLLKRMRLEQAASLHGVRDTLGAQFDRLQDITRRRSDEDGEGKPRILLKDPVLVALADPQDAVKVVNQLSIFGFRGEHMRTPEELVETALGQPPQTLVIDVNFGGPGNGLKCAQEIQHAASHPIPVVFISTEPAPLPVRLSATRSGGEEFLEGKLDTTVVVEKVEQFTRHNLQTPYKILVVDDSRAQATYAESLLRKSGLEPRIVTDPMQVLDVLQAFTPDIIIMDMYMPGCNGTELAKVIRQDDRYVSVPIIYLSAEDDVNKQLHAMSLGGDDFLVKPINPRQLLATIHNRGRRARALKAQMIRDSLTGLYNHTHTLNLLEDALTKARQTGKPVSFVMLDIDHFKSVNDTWGHPVGDRVLKSLSLFLKQRLRKTDHIGRYGGEEFAIILPETRLADARSLMDDIRERFYALRHPTEGQDISVSFSAGIASAVDSPMQALTDHADKALYEAKRKGRNQVCCA